MNSKEYSAYVKKMGPKSPIWKDCFNAFWIGGLICVLGHLIQNGYAAAGLDKTDAGTATSMSLVVLSILLTGFSLYDNLAKVAGAGTLVPITGFANSIAAPAIEFRSEGIVTGTSFDSQAGIGSGYFGLPQLGSGTLRQTKTMASLRRAHTVRPYMGAVLSGGCGTGFFA